MKAAACSEAFKGGPPVSRHRLGCSGLRCYFWNPCVVNPLPSCAKSQSCLLISLWFSSQPTSPDELHTKLLQPVLTFHCLQQLGRLTFREHKQLHFASLLLSNKYNGFWEFSNLFLTLFWYTELRCPSQGIFLLDSACFTVKWLNSASGFEIHTECSVKQHHYQVWKKKCSS